MINDQEALFTRQKQYRTVGLVMFCVALGLLAARVLAALIGGSLSDIATDVVFSLLMQVGILLTLPFLLYTLLLKKKPRAVLEFSNVRRVEWPIALLAIPLGFCALIATIGVSTAWYAFLTAFGYAYNPVTVWPVFFRPEMLVLELVLSALLPGLCEEFTNRGGFLTVLRGSFSERQTVLLGGLAFGLFHQNIQQLFYTFLFGMLMTFLTLRLKSVIPAMIVHFVNNGLSVYLDYAGQYGFFGGGLFDWINARLTQGMALGLVGLYVLIVLLGAGIVVLMLMLKRRAAARTAAAGEEPARLPLSDTVLYRPTLRDNAFFIGAIAAAVATTLFTFLAGLL